MQLRVSAMSCREKSDTNKREFLARLFDAIGHPARIFTLESLEKGKNPVEIAEELGIKRGALQAHLDKLMQADLIWQDPNDQSERYLVQPLGSKTLEVIKQVSRELKVDQLLQAFKKIEDRFPKLEGEENIEISVESGFGFPVSRKFYEKAVRKYMQKLKNEEMEKIFKQ
jgi:DNA-binding MarR family transcriptional regulator